MPIVNTFARKQTQIQPQLLPKLLCESFLQIWLRLNSMHFCSCTWMHKVNTQRVLSASVSGRSIFIQIQRERLRLGCGGLQTLHGAEAGRHFLCLCR